MEVILRPLQEEDAHTSVKWRNIPEIWAMTGSAPDHEITVEEELAWIRRVMADESRRSFAILADGVYVGNTYLTGIHDGTAEFHIFIGDQDYWGKGVAKRATNAALSFAKHDLQLANVTLGVRKENGAALHIYQKLGFQEVAEKDGFTQMRLELKDFADE